MGLGNRNARRHGSNDSQSAYWQFKPGQRVMTVDGFAGVVASVEDGPHAGNEHYIVNLDSGMGGGAYQPGQLTALRQETAEHHTAGDDYPELSQILVERPDIAPNVVASRKTANDHDADHYMSTEDCPEGEQPGFEHGHLTWGGQAAQGEGNDYSLFPMPRTANASCPQCGFYDGMMDGGGPCPLCGATTEGTTHQAPDESYSESCPTCGYYSGAALPHHDMCPICKTPTQHTAGQFNGTEECDHCGSAAHSTGEHNNIDLREQNPDAVDYGHECEYCGSEDHTTDDHEDEPQDDDAFIHHDGSASFGHKFLGRPPYGHDDPHEWAHHAIEQEMQGQGYYPNVWNEHGDSCHEHHAESVAERTQASAPLRRDGTAVPGVRCGC
jgi:rubrerythrin